MAVGTDPRVGKPAERFVVKDEDLSTREKKDALDTWEQDARQLLVASDEGMPDLRKA